MFASDTTQESIEFDEEAFEQVILYICSTVDNIRDLSLTKLHKILYYADREIYLETGKPLTGETYIKNDHGPFSTRLKSTLDSLEERGLLEQIQKRDRSSNLGRYVQNCFVAKEPANVEIFSSSQVDLLNDIAQEIQKEHTSKTISETSHDLVSLHTCR